MPSSNDYETAFESLLENLSTVPTEIRRNLEHIRELDRICSTNLILLRKLQQEFIIRSENKMMKLKIKIVQPNTKDHRIPTGGSTPIRKYDPTDDTTTATDTSTTSYRLAVKVLDDDTAVNNNNKRKINDDNNKNNESTPSDDAYTATDHDKKENNQNNNTDNNDDDYDDDDDCYVIPTTEELMDYIMTDDENDNEQNDDNDNNDNNNSNNQKNHTTLHTKKKKKNNPITDDLIVNDDTMDVLDDDNNNNNNNNNSNYSNNTAVIDRSSTRGEADNNKNKITIVSSLTSLQSVSTKVLYQHILELQKDCTQKTNEKIEVAKQTYELIHSNHIQRLNIDIMTMEKYIVQTSGGDALNTGSGTGIGGGTGTTGGIGGVGTGIGGTGTGSGTSLGGGGMGNSGGGGGMGTPAVANINDLAACQLTPGSEWILSKVISYDHGMYTLSDEDIESDKIFNLPESQVIILPGNPSRSGSNTGTTTDYKVTKGDVVFAIYPDTTSFYKATVVQAPRKQPGTTERFVMVHFVDDSDEFGITHDKAVPLKYIMPPPAKT